MNNKIIEIDSAYIEDILTKIPLYDNLDLLFIDFKENYFDLRRPKYGVGSGIDSLPEKKDGAAALGLTAVLEFLSATHNASDARKIMDAIKANPHFSSEVPSHDEGVAVEQGLYAGRLQNESAYDFIMRTNPDLPRYRGKRVDGDIINFLRRTYQDLGYLDGVIFTRATLRKLDPTAEMALKNWLRSPKNMMPSDLKIPAKRGQAAHLVKGLSKETISAVLSAQRQHLV